MTNEKITNGRGSVLSEIALRTYANRAWHEKQMRRGRTIHEMAVAVGKSRPTLVKWRFRLGLTRHGRRLSGRARRTHAHETWLRTMIEVKKLSTKEVAARSRVSVQTIEEWMGRFGIKVPPRDDQKERTFLNVAWLTPRVTKGYTNVMIAEIVGCPVHHVTYARGVCGLPRSAALQTGGLISERARIGKWLTKRLPRTKLTSDEHMVLAYFYGVRHPFRNQQFIAQLTGRTRAWVQLVRKCALAKVAARWRVPSRLAPFFFTLRVPPSASSPKNGRKEDHRECVRVAPVS